MQRSPLRWPDASYHTVRILEGVSSGIREYRNIYRSSFDIEGFPFCKRLELYCVARRGRDALLIDTGNPDLCGTRALAGVSGMLGVPWEDTSVFMTHFHDDHDGNLPYCVSHHVKTVYSGAVRPATQERKDAFLRDVDARDLACDELDPYLDMLMVGNAAAWLGSTNHVTCHGGEVIPAAGFQFEVIATPGHTSNHLCLLDRERKILFSGDHVIDAPPGLPQLEPDQHLIEQYLKSLTLVRNLDLEVLLMSHHEPLFGSQSIDGFVHMIKERYASLVRRTIGYVREAGRVSVREASVMAARHYAHGLDGFSVAVRCRRIAMMFASLEYLHDRGLAERGTGDDGQLVYWLTSQGKLYY